MKQWLGIAVVSWVVAAGQSFAEEDLPTRPHAAVAPAASDGEGHASAHGEANVAGHVAEHILHHVADDTTWTLEIPFPPYEALTIDLDKAFGWLLIERVPGACSMEVTGPLTAAPSLGRWLAGCWDFRPTKAVLMIWLAMALLGALLFFGRAHNLHGVPKGVLAHVIEALLLFVRDEIAIANIGKEEGPKYTPYLATVFFFIMCTNYLGLLPGMFTGTGALAVTAAMGLITFVVVQVAGIRSAGIGGYVAHLFGDVPGWMKPLMFVVEFIGLLTKPFALLVRLFANMVAGHLVIFFLLSLIFVVHVGAAVLSVPLASAIYLLELFVAILQAYIFTLLTALFIGQSVAMGHHHATEAGHVEGREHGVRH
jgi:F-type H+-transporting ATPase subunit a